MDVLNTIAIIVGVAVPVVGAIWFLMSRASGWGASTKEQKMLLEAFKRSEQDTKENFNKLASEMKENFDKQDAKIDKLSLEMKENFDKLDTKIESVRTELKGEIGEVKKDTNSRMDRIEDRMDRLETGQRNIINEVASVKNNESKFSLDIARWLFARSTERKSEEVLP